MIRNLLRRLYWRLLLIDKFEATEQNRKLVTLAQRCARLEQGWFYKSETWMIARIDVSRDGRFVYIYGWPK